MLLVCLLPLPAACQRLHQVACSRITLLSNTTC